MLAYCGNNSVNMMDPTGYLAIQDTRQFLMVMALGVTLATAAHPNADEIVDGFRDVVDTITDNISEFFDKSVPLTPNELEEIAKGYKIEECLQAAEAMQEKNNGRGNIVHLEFPNAYKGFVCSERFTFAISKNGNHYGYLYQGIVYCNIYPEGRRFPVWINSFYDASGTAPIVRIY